MTRYAFGDSDVAGDRLEVVARVFERPTRAFLERVDIDPPDLVVDLGCGPGYTTRLLTEVLKPSHTVGLDLSSGFVERATREAPSGVSFRVHDGTEVPFPVGPADLLFCRYLLCHLEDPFGVMTRWATQLRPGGLLLVEEAESITSDVDVFGRYVELQKETLGSQSNDLFIGPRLAGEAPPAGLSKRASVRAEHEVPTPDVATMFAMNFVTWSQHPFVKKRLGTEGTRSMQSELDRLRSGTPSGQNVWQLRQMLYEKA
jgi:SAM-dependent methyltransferase